MDAHYKTLTETEYSDGQCINPTDVSKLTVSLTFPGGTQSRLRGDAGFVDTVINGLNENGEGLNLASPPPSALMDYGVITLDKIKLYQVNPDDDVVDSRETRASASEQVPFLRL